MPVGNVRAIILDIEGTIAPVSFVSDVLFPYAMREVKQYLHETWHHPETRACIAELKNYLDGDGYSIPPVSGDKYEVQEALSSALIDMMSKDRKYPPLKRLQGAIWRGGYRSGALVADLYEDFFVSLRKWTAMGIKVYIYSSGSREAQGLLFRHTRHGDLRSYISGYFDTTVGRKNEAKSYEEIAMFIGETDYTRLLFATDVHAEALAASKVGLQTILVVRPGNKPLPQESSFPVVFDTTGIDSWL